jgi:hypothetical protein
MNVRVCTPKLWALRPSRGGQLKEEVGQMQNVNTMIRRPIPIGTALASGLVAFAAGAVIALGAPVVVTGLSASHNSNAVVSAPAVHVLPPDAQERNEQLSLARNKAPEETHGH